MNNHERTVRPSGDRQYAVCFVCSGNICRSPMAEVVLRALVYDAGLGESVLVDSAGTGDWHIGERADRRTVAALAARGYDGTAHRARQFEPDWFATHDLVVALDRGHLRTLGSWAPTDRARKKLHLLRSFDPDLPMDTFGDELDVPDPYYDGTEAFSAVLSTIEVACTGLLDTLVRDGVGRSARGRAVG